ncbi:MAG: hypothetical protein HY690_10240 [Chloroflexi bacterium]|nr:hypothetical protein [Chloroflexota bacterium]
MQDVGRDRQPAAWQHHRHQARARERERALDQAHGRQTSFQDDTAYYRVQAFNHRSILASRLCVPASRRSLGPLSEADN